MIKKGQSLLDFLHSLPLDLLQKTPRSPISNQEAQTLFKIWKNGTDENGKLIIPDNVDLMQVASLITKGLIKSHPISLNATKTVDITPKGKAIIRNIILYSETSAFEKSSEYINYDEIHQSAMSGARSVKTASNQMTNWLIKISH